MGVYFSLCQDIYFQMQNIITLRPFLRKGRRHDVGDKLGFLEATVEFALKRDNLKVPFMKYLQTLKCNDNFNDLYNEVACTREK